MSFDWRRGGFAAAAGGVLLLDALLRLAAGEPYPGATGLLLAACALALVPFLPAEVGRPSLLLAMLPAVALASFAILLTTVSVVGIPLTELSVRLAVLCLVAVLAALAVLLQPVTFRPTRWSSRREWLAVAALVAVFAFSFASSWDVVDPFPPRGMDWGHYLLYADEVAEQRALLVDDPLAGEEGRLFADPPAVGALYGSFRILDGISSWSLGFGVIVISALTVLSVYAAAGGLWGLEAGLAAAAAYAVAPIRLEPMYWHGLGTTLALVFLPLVVLSLGLMWRGHRDGRVLGLLALALLGVAVSHSTSAVVVAVLLVTVPIVDLGRQLLSNRGAVRQALRSWWRDGIVRPLVGGVALAGLLGAGVMAHLRLQAADLGPPVSYRFFEPDWLEPHTLVDYYSWAFIGLVAVSLVLVLSARTRRDLALLAVAALALAAVLVSQLWRIHVPFEYRRAVFYLGIAMVLVVGVAALRVGRSIPWLAAYAVVLAYIAHSSIGLRLPERLLAGPEQTSAAVAGLVEFREELDSGRLPDASLVVADRCLHFVVPYLLRRPTIPAFEDWQVGFENRIALARRAAAVIEGGAAGRRVVESMGVRYVVADPRCTPNPAPGLGGTVVLRNAELVVVELARRAA